MSSTAGGGSGGGGGAAIDVEVTGSGVKAAWHPYDAESKIADIRWAVGTSKGGEQLQAFTAVGAETTTGAAIVRNGVPHGTEVHVTVAVTNRAGQSAVFYSDPVTADATPPVGAISIARGFADGVISADLGGIADPESGIVSCSWGVGTQPGLVDLFGWTLALKEGGEEGAAAFAMVSTGKAIAASEHGLEVYVSARCENSARLSSVISSAAAVIVEETIDPDAMAEVLSPPTHVSDRALTALPGYQTSTSEVHFRWSNFFAKSNMLDYYESKIVRKSDMLAVTGWVNEGARSASSAVGLSLADGSTYLVKVRAMNVAGEMSAVKTAEVFVMNDAPVVSSQSIGETGACATLDIVGLTVGWRGVFVEANVASPALRYTISIGFDPFECIDKYGGAIEARVSACGAASDKEACELVTMASTSDAEDELACSWDQRGPGAGDVLRGRDIVTPATRGDLTAKTVVQLKDLPSELKMKGAEMPADVAKQVAKLHATVTAVNQAGIATTTSFFLPPKKCGN